MSASAPDVGALLMYDFYSPMEEQDGEERVDNENNEERRERGNNKGSRQRLEGRQRVDNEHNEVPEDTEEYSIITELFAALSSE